MTTVLEFPDLELWASAYLRAGLVSWSARVGRRWPPADGTATGYDVVVRDDSGPSGQFTADRNLAVTVIGPEGSHAETGRVAERVAVLLRASPEDPSTPVARCTTVRGPYAVDSDSRRPAFYLTADLRVVGTSITL